MITVNPSNRILRALAHAVFAALLVVGPSMSPIDSTDGVSNAANRGGGGRGKASGGHRKAAARPSKVDRKPRASSAKRGSVKQANRAPKRQAEPAARPAKPTARPAAKPAARPATQQTRPNTRPATQQAKRPADNKLGSASSNRRTARPSSAIAAVLRRTAAISTRSCRITRPRKRPARKPATARRRRPTSVATPRQRQAKSVAIARRQGRTRATQGR